jgi:hypothetical protein
MEQQQPKTIELCPALQHPFTCLVSGATQSGKSEWIFRLLTSISSRNCKNNKIEPQPQNILYCYSEEQPALFERYRQAEVKIKFHKGLPPPIEEFSPAVRNLLVLDDLMQETGSAISALFTRGSHHRNLSIILVTQNLFHQSKEFRTISLNSSYLVIFKNPRDNTQIEHLARQMFPKRSMIVQDAFHRATQRPYGYLLVDLKQSTPDEARLRTNIFNELGTGASCELFIPI